MIFILMIFDLVKGGLNILSPDQISEYSINVAVASFGNPFLYPQYGKMFLISNNSTCSIPNTFPPNTFAVLYGFENCYFSDVAYAMQTAGAIGMIRVHTNDLINFLMIPEDETLGNLINILVISIPLSL